MYLILATVWKMIIKLPIQQETRLKISPTWLCLWFLKMLPRLCIHRCLRDLKCLKMIQFSQKMFLCLLSLSYKLKLVPNQELRLQKKRNSKHINQKWKIELLNSRPELLHWKLKLLNRKLRSMEWIKKIKPLNRIKPSARVPKFWLWKI